MFDVIIDNKPPQKYIVVAKQIVTEKTVLKAYSNGLTGHPRPSQYSGK